MEGTESEAVFESLNLNPTLILNDILNTVENLFDQSFDYFLREASTLLNAGAGGSDRSQHLAQGIRCIRDLIESNVGNRLAVWQKFCFHRSFAVPQGFSLHESELPSESLTCKDMLSDAELDNQLDFLREKLAVVGKESAKLSQELQALERQSASNDGRQAIVNEALQLYVQNGTEKMFQEMVSVASQLRSKVENLQTKRIEHAESTRREKIHNALRGLSTMNVGLSNAEFEDIKNYLADLD